MERSLVRHAHPYCYVLLKVEGADTQFLVGDTLCPLTDATMPSSMAGTHDLADRPTAASQGAQRRPPDNVADGDHVCSYRSCVAPEMSTMRANPPNGFSSTEATRTAVGAVTPSVVFNR